MIWQLSIFWLGPWSRRILLDFPRVGKFVFKWTIDERRLPGVTV